MLTITLTAEECGEIYDALDMQIGCIIEEHDYDVSYVASLVMLRDKFEELRK